MAIKFNNDGTIECRAVKYNWYQARNMIADGCFGNYSNYNTDETWRFYNGSIDAMTETDGAGYKSWRCFKISNGQRLSQWLPKFQYNEKFHPNFIDSDDHKYYFSCRVKTKSTSNFIGLQLWSGTNQLNDKFCIFEYNLNTNDEWKLVSKIFGLCKLTSYSEPTYSSWPIYPDPTEAPGAYPIYTAPSDSWTLDGKVRIAVTNSDSSNPVYITQFIMIDLTDTFGQGNEPSQEWCDNNIREHEVIVNYGNTAPAVRWNNFKDFYDWSGHDTAYLKNYLETDDTSFPRDYYCEFKSLASDKNWYVKNQSNEEISANEMYYSYWDLKVPSYSADLDIAGTWSTFNLPADTKTIGQEYTDTRDYYTPGGGCRDWIRKSGAGFPFGYTGNYKPQWVFNNNNQAFTTYFTAINCMRVQSNIDKYNEYNNCSISLDDVNRSWCDRWIDGRASSIIHIRDPKSTTLKFNVKDLNVIRITKQSFTSDSITYLMYASQPIMKDYDLHDGDKLYYSINEYTISNLSFTSGFAVAVFTLTVGINDLFAKKVEEGTTSLKLYVNRGTDIECNDIVIQPERNNISFDSTTGTLYCKKLITADENYRATIDFNPIYMQVRSSRSGKYLNPGDIFDLGAKFQFILNDDYKKLDTYYDWDAYIINNEDHTSNYFTYSNSSIKNFNIKIRYKWKNDYIDSVSTTYKSSTSTYSERVSLEDYYYNYDKIELISTIGSSTYTDIIYSSTVPLGTTFTHDGVNIVVEKYGYVYNDSQLRVKVTPSGSKYVSKTVMNAYKLATHQTIIK